MTAEEQCDDMGGDWQGYGSVCFPNPCASGLIGACCNGGASCADLSPDDCLLLGGQYQGDGSDCGSVSCPTVACCFSDGSCLELTEYACINDYAGSFTPGIISCADDPCRIGACCQVDGICVVDTSGRCAQLWSGVFQGTGTNCDTPGACAPVCEPTPAADACMPAACSEPGHSCVPRCFHYNPFTGQGAVTACECRASGDCQAVLPGLAVGCVQGDIGGTAAYPPNCPYWHSPNDHWLISDGLPAGTTVEIDVTHANFDCTTSGDTVCSFADPVDCTQSGGSLSGEQACRASQFQMHLIGTGTLAGFDRHIDLPISFETHSAPRSHGNPVQAFDTDMFRLFGQITGDPDFDLLRITGGSDFGLPSPGHTTMTQLPGSNWAIDSFFDITYRIDFVGRPGGALAGRSGSTTGTIRMSTGAGNACEGACPAGYACQSSRMVNPDGTIDICCECIPVVTGACCLPGDCQLLTESDCANAGGVFTAGETCAADCDGDGVANPCDPDDHSTVVLNPADQTACAGSDVTIHADASGTGLSYQWYFGTELLSDLMPYSGTQTATLTISGIGFDQAGLYHVDVTNDCAAVTTSSNAAVMVVASPVCAITGPPSVVSEWIAYSASVPDAGPGATYLWSVSNGELVGRTDGRSVHVGSYAIDSFFDVFCDVTQDGCTESCTLRIPSQQRAKTCEVEFNIRAVPGTGGDCTGSSSCYSEGETITIDLEMSGLNVPVAGFQAFVQYDPALLDYVSGSYTDNPFDNPPVDPIDVDETLGHIDLANGINLDAGQNPTDQDAVLATLTFVVREDTNACVAAPAISFRSHDPPSRMTDLDGNSFDATNGVIYTNAADITFDSTAPVVTAGMIDTCYPTVDDAEDAAIAATTIMDNCTSTAQLIVTATTVGDCATTITVTACDSCGNEASVEYDTRIDNAAPTFTGGCPRPPINAPYADADTCTAAVSVPTPAVTDLCTATASILVSGTRDDSQPLNAPYPIGTTTITWTATDECNNAAMCTQQVIVPNLARLELSVQLDGAFPVDFTRCVRLELYDCTDVTPTATIVDADLSFDNGLAAAQTVLVPCGDYTCVTARDRLHTLRRTAGNFMLSGTQYTASFLSADSNALLSGNLNDDPFVDILDYGIWAGRYLQMVSPNTPCLPPLTRHADIDGSGEVFIGDFTFILLNFLRSSDNTCCTAGFAEGGPFGNTQPLQFIKTQELLNRGMADIAQGDVNHDGLLSMDDIALMLEGATPPAPDRESADQDR